MKKKLVSLLVLVVLAFSLTACGGGGGDASGEVVTLSFGHTNNTDHHYQVLAESFKQIVEEKTGGQIVIDIYPAEQLGSGTEMMEAVVSGTQDLVLNPDAYLANYDPIFNTIGMPYVFKTWDDVKALAGSEAATKLEAKAEEQGMVILGWAANGFRIFSSNNPIEKPEDMAGLKIRIGNGTLVTEVVSTLGAAPTPLSVSDTYSGIQTGVVDGAENSQTNVIGSKWYEVQDYIATTHHQYSTEPLIMNKAKFDSLTPEQQQILKEAAAEVCAADVDFCASEAESEAEFLKEQGVTITYPDMTVFEETLKPVVDSYIEQYGAEFEEIYNMLKGNE